MTSRPPKTDRSTRRATARAATRSQRGPASPGPTPNATPSRSRRPWILALVGVAVVAVLVAGYVLATAAGPSATPAPSAAAGESASPAASAAAGSSAASASSAASGANATTATSAAGSASAGALPGLSTAPPPWPPETANLLARLNATGLPALSAEGTVLHIHQHIDIYVDGQAVAVPADIGIDAAQQFLSPIHTHDTTGIIHVESPTMRDFTLGEFFDVWGVRFDGHCLGGTCDGDGRTLSVYVNGQPVTGDPRAVKLAAHQEIVVAVGTAAQLPSPIPSSYQFPQGY